MPVAGSGDRPMNAVRGVRARACCRVDLAGGTLDIWPLGVLHPGATTVNVAIDVEAEVQIVARSEGYRLDIAGGEDQGREILEFPGLAEVASDDRTALFGLVAAELGLPPVEIRVGSGSPRGGGLGGSSALAIALIAAAENFLGRVESTPDERSALARDLEARLMQLPTGRQDHYPALLGGVLEIRYSPGGESVRRLEVDLGELGRCMTVAYSGMTHFSADNNWRVIRRRLDGDHISADLFAGIAKTAAEMVRPLEAGDYAEVGRLMGVEWEHRRQLDPAVTTETIEDLLRVGMAAGAWGGKVCGAGGGGCVVLLSPADRTEAVRRALTAGGAEVLAAVPSSRPVSVEEIG